MRKSKPKTTVVYLKHGYSLFIEQPKGKDPLKITIEGSVRKKDICICQICN